jgi:hypothetical protein
MKFVWHPTNAPQQTRYDDIFFPTPLIGWGINRRG